MPGKVEEDQKGNFFPQGSFHEVAKQLFEAQGHTKPRACMLAADKKERGHHLLTPQAGSIHIIHRLLLGN